MSTGRPYRYRGVRLSIADVDDDDNAPVRQWFDGNDEEARRRRRKDSDDPAEDPDYDPDVDADIDYVRPRRRRKELELNHANLARKGLILLDIRGGYDRVFLVHGEDGDGEGSSDNGSDPTRNLRKFSLDLPEDLRISTWDGGDESACVLPADASCFVQIKAWQQLDNDTYSLYFEYLNGGSLEDVLRNFHQANYTPIPESFIWHVTEQLATAFAFLHFGIEPGTNDKPNNWTRVYHRDFSENNVFIHYPSPRPGSLPRSGFEPHAFPRVALGDFGDSGVAGDDESKLHYGTLNSTELKDWQDIYDFGSILRALCMTHVEYHYQGIHGDYQYADERYLEDVNHHPNSPGYSDELIGLLQRFERPDQELDNILDEDAWKAMPADANWIINTLLPAARNRMQNYRNPPGGKPRGYYDDMDVSWTRPDELMPFRFFKDLADPVDRPNYAGDWDNGFPDGKDDRRGLNGRELDMAKLRSLRKLPWPAYEVVDLHCGTWAYLYSLSVK
ncbi:uncharacterized protein JN550_006284 [Neoarthrinium moseri]|uniref:uncharacterized protein n=1 Tax=Neoarthrinium moseri TaxID=1658444 RepID=UPI001FDC3F84|nr:uncharacterized protein JN550_006284 [Neoarthrinium moseri]KAI1868709.1 hypothetical protein JN550_006284 [Neoarthrinium moseri]